MSKPGAYVLVGFRRCLSRSSWVSSALRVAGFRNYWLRSRLLVSGWWARVSRPRRGVSALLASPSLLVPLRVPFAFGECVFGSPGLI